LLAIRDTLQFLFETVHYTSWPAACGGFGGSRTESGSPQDPIRDFPGWPPTDPWL
jgi:hypothetical protein